MADDIDELLDEVESKYINSENETQIIPREVVHKCGESGGSEELDAAIDSICSITEPMETTTITSSIRLDKTAKRKCTVVYVGGNASSEGLSSGVSQRRNTSHRKQRPSSTTKVYTKRFFAKPVFELSVKDLEAESARRKQKEVIERLFERKMAVVTDKMILDVRKFKRIKSDVWSNFGDVRLLIDEAEVKKFNIDHHVIHIGEEEVLLCKSFVACVKCSAVFSYESHSYGTSTLRSHLKSCGKQRYRTERRSQLRLLRRKKNMSDVSINGNIESGSYGDHISPPVFQEQMMKFRDETFKVQKQVLLFFLSKMKSFNTINNTEFQKLLQTCVKIGASSGNMDISHFLCSQNDLTEDLLNMVYSKCVSSFELEMRTVYGVSFSMEIWNDIVEKTSYLSLTCNYANNEGTFRSVVLQTFEFAYKDKTPEDLNRIFYECLSLMNLDTFKRIVIIDYAYNMVHAFGNELFIQCICYSLNCAVQSVINTLSVPEDENDPFTLPSFESLITQCRSLVLHFKQNKLQQNLPRHLQMCSSTCWKSVLKMLESINSQWDHIVDILSERNELNLFNFDEELLSIAVDFLEIFRDGSEELSSVMHPTLNIVIPWWTKWKTHCLHKDDESPFLAALKSFMSSALDGDVTKKITVFHKVATMLDPRFKELQFLSATDREEARQKAEELVEECKEATAGKLDQNDDSNEALMNDKFADLYSDTLYKNSGDSTSTQEVKDYLLEPFIMNMQDLDSENKFNPLRYWVRAQVRFPNLCKVASWILSCPASSVRSEDNMLDTDWIVSVKETELPQKYIHKAIFVNSFNNL